MACAFVVAFAWTAGARAEGAPDAGVVFRLPGRSHEIVSDSLRGHVVVLDFWASWCAPCRKSFPWLGSIHSKYAQRGLRVVAVNLDKKRALADAFLLGFEPAFDVAFDPSGKTAAAFRVAAMPTTIVLDREGRVIRRHGGFDPARTAEFEAFLEEELAR